MGRYTTFDAVTSLLTFRDEPDDDGLLAAGDEAEAELRVAPELDVARPRRLQVVGVVARVIAHRHRRHVAVGREDERHGQ